MIAPEPMPVRLGQITVFPIKALDGVSVESCRITSRGILENDRTYAMVDAAGKYVNGKRDARVHRLRCRFDPQFREAAIRVEGGGPAGQFALDEPSALNRWLSEYFGFAVELRHDAEAGFPDDREAFGPTVVTEASLQAIAAWFPGVTLASIRRRFRANLELEGEGLAAFWEDRLYDTPGERKPFQIGDLTLLGHNPCQRCVVPTRDPESGEGMAGFQKEFMERRRESLPAWANATRFNHFYRFAVNTSIPPSEAGKVLRAGDPVEVPELCPDP